MASTINASSTGSGGLINTGDASGQLDLQANGSTKLSVTSSGVSITGGIASPLTVTGNSTAGAELRLPEDTDNGSNYVALKAADSIASNVTFTLPSADGTNRQVQQTNGSGTLSFATPSAGWTLVSTLTASSSATIDVEDNFTTYDAYALVITDLTAASSTDLRCRLKVGGTYITTTTYRMARRYMTYANTTYSAQNQADTTDYIDVFGYVGTTAESMGVVWINGALLSNASVSNQVFGTWQGYYAVRGDNIFGESTSGACTGLRFYMSTGNITTGKFRLYGIQN